MKIRKRVESRKKTKNGCSFRMWSDGPIRYGFHDGGPGTTPYIIVDGGPGVGPYKKFKEIRE